MERKWDASSHVPRPSESQESVPSGAGLDVCQDDLRRRSKQTKTAPNPNPEANSLSLSFFFSLFSNPQNPPKRCQRERGAVSFPAPVGGACCLRDAVPARHPAQQIPRPRIAPITARNGAEFMPSSLRSVGIGKPVASGSFACSGGARRRRKRDRPSRPWSTRPIHPRAPAPPIQTPINQRIHAT